MVDHTPRIDCLALCYENTITSIVRLGMLSPEKMPSAENFRKSIAGALKVSREKGKSLGYASETNNSAFFAVVAFLDESVLQLQNPSFAAWAQRPLQEELFNHNRAGEIFFDNLRGLLAREESQDTADCLEVYCLCLLLGFRGRYASGMSDSAFFPHVGTGGFANVRASRPGGEIDTLIRQAREKITRVRGQMLFLRGDAPPPKISPTATIDRWSHGLAIAAVCLLVLCLLAFGGFWVLLSTRASQAP
jgi:type VI secretion system protein ImpK